MVFETVIRDYKQDDSREVGILIADTYWKYNLTHITDEEKEKYLGGFFNCRSCEKHHKEKIIALINAPFVLLAETTGRISGVLRGSPGRLHSLFVHEEFHRMGIGSMLVSEFEDKCRQSESKKITLAASLYAVPFYFAQGYKKSTGVRKSRSFDGGNFYIQPMKKQI